MPVSPTIEGFRTAFRRPSLALGEITWRWVVGATATVLFFFGLFEYLSTLPVSKSELFLLRTRHPYLVLQALTHILRGNLNRGLLSLLLAALLISLLWIIAGSLGRIATVRVLIERFGGETASPASVGSFRTLFRLNFLRVAVAIAAMLGFAGAAILISLIVPDSQPGISFLLFFPLVGLIALVSWALNWLLSLAAIFAVRDGEEAIDALAATIALCRERTGAVLAVSTWTALAHLVAFIGATTIVSMPLGFVPIIPGRLVFLAVVLISLAYLALVDWLYMARLAGYVCITEMPMAVLPAFPPPSMEPTPTIQASIDRDELILSDVPLTP